MSETAFVKTEAGLYSLHEQSEDVVVDLAKQILSAKLQSTGISLTSASQAKDLAYCELAGEEREVFAVAFLNTQHHLISFERLFLGTISSSPVFPRELVKRSLELNSAAVLLVHNHPSGVSEPSKADVEITGLIQEALNLVDCRVLDHLIVSANGVHSFAENGEL